MADSTQAEWLSLKTAGDVAGMSRRTLQSWVEKKWVERRQGVDGWQVTRASVLATLAARQAGLPPDEYPECPPPILASVAEALADDGALEVYQAEIGGKFQLSIITSIVGNFMREGERNRELLGGVIAENGALRERIGVAETQRDYALAALQGARDRVADLEADLAAARAIANAPPPDRRPAWVRALFGDPAQHHGSTS